MRCSYPVPEMLYEFGLREPLKSSASEKCTVGLNGLVEFEMFSEPHVAPGDSIQIDAYEPGEERNPRRRCRREHNRRATALDNCPEEANIR